MHKFATIKNNPPKFQSFSTPFLNCIPCLKNSQSMFFCRSYPASLIPHKFNYRHPFFYDLCHLSNSKCKVLFLVKCFVKNLTVSLRMVLIRDTLRLIFSMKHIVEALNCQINVKKYKQGFVNLTKSPRYMKNITYKENILFLLFALIFILYCTYFVLSDFESALILYLWWRNKIS